MAHLPKIARRLLGTSTYVRLRESRSGRALHWLLGPKSERDRWFWVRRCYRAHAVRQREEIFLGIARFAHINRPITGYYMEFGCHEGNSMRLAWHHFRHLFDWHYAAFDSFEGLPDMPPEEASSIFRAGNLATSEDEFRRIMARAGMPPDRLVLFKGFYQETLNDELASGLLPNKAAVVYVDCDLYSSTKCVLKFIRPFLQTGTVIVFDDWFCYRGDPEKGEQRAWREFLSDNPDIRTTEYIRTCEAQCFIVVDPDLGD